MTFKIAEGPVKVWWPVKVEMPVDGGRFHTFEFKALFEILDLDEFEDLADAADETTRNLKRLEKLTRQITEEAEGAPEKPIDIVRDVLVRVTHGWKEIVSEATNEPVPFETGLFVQLLQKPYFRQGLHNAYLACQSGRRIKN